MKIVSIANKKNTIFATKNTSSFEKKQITASMTSHVSGFPYGEFPDLENLLDLSYAIQGYLYRKLNGNKKLFDDFLSTHFRFDSVTPDGGDHFKDKGIMNVYLKGLNSGNYIAFIGYVLESLNSLPGVNAKYLQVDFDQNKMPRVARLSVQTENVGANQKPPDFNMTNANARKIFIDILGYTNFSEGYEFEPFELKNKCVNKKGKVNLPDIPVVDIKNNKGPRIIQFNINENYVENILNKIIDVCNWAIKNGYNGVYWV